MHESVMTWLGERRWTLGILTGWRILEVGSYNENGSPRTIFEPLCASYTGLDMRAGPGVDEVGDASALPWKADHFDLVISTEMLEHDQRPWVSVSQMARVLRYGGHLLMTARGFDEYHGCYPEHPCPGDYWRFNIHSFSILIREAGLKPIEIMRDPEVPGVFAHAVKVPGLR